MFILFCMDHIATQVFGQENINPNNGVPNLAHTGNIVINHNYAAANHHYHYGDDKPVSENTSPVDHNPTIAAHRRTNSAP